MEEEVIIEEAGDNAYEQKIFTIDKGEEPKRVDKWLQARLENATRSKIQRAIETGLLTVNGKVVKSNYKIKPGDQLVLMTISTPDAGEVLAENIPLDIVYEDDAILVINKPPDMVVHPGVGNYTGTLLNGVAWHLQQNQPGITEETLPRFGMVHRIDKNTTGLILLAKTAEAAVHLAKQFFNHTIERKYTAVVWGDVQADKGTINVNIARHQRFRKMFTAYPDGDVGKTAITHYQVLERLHYVTVVECTLETGRTHQIRVHMKYLNHTLFNDWEYGGDKILKGTVYTKYKQFVDNCFEVCPRCALHAKTLGFTHPVTGERLLFESPLPDDMQALIAKWRKYVEARILENE